MKIIKIFLAYVRKNTYLAQVLRIKQKQNIMTKKIYANKIVKNTLNTYMRSVYFYDTAEEVYIGMTKDNTRYMYAKWDRVQRAIVVKWVSEDDTCGTTPLNKFSVNIQNFIVRSLLNSMHDDMVYRMSDEYVRGE